MKEQKFRIIFKGEILPNSNIEEVKQKFSTYYKVDLHQVESLFSGKKFVLKENISLDFARKYAVEFEKMTGARCTIIQMVEKDTEQKPQQQTTASKAAPPTAKTGNTPTRYETCYRVMFKGNIQPGKDINEVKTNLCMFYKVKPDRLAGLFTGKPVVIKETIDFWTAVAYLNQFKEFGAACYLDTEDPPENQNMEAKEQEQVQPVQTLSSQPVSEESEEHRIKAQADALTKHFNNTYLQVQQEYGIKKKEKEFQKRESTLGCLALIIIVAALVLIIFSSLAWYWGLLWGVIALVILIAFEKKWNTKYADAFLWRLKKEKQEDFSLFAVVLKKWANKLPAKDRAKPYLQKKIDEIIAENHSQEGMYEKYSRIISPEKELDVLASQPQEVAVNCPRCGSNQITTGIRKFSWKKGIAVSIFLGPLAGAVAGSTGEGKPIYICETCGKKWDRR
jgi:hypothetical protein